MRKVDFSEKQLETRGFKQPKIYYVMRNRGNNEIAPPKELLEWWLSQKKLWESYRGGDHWDARGKLIDWPTYKRRYLKHLETEEATEWMRRIAKLSKEHAIILVCYEKDFQHCHRTLLAKRIQFLHNVNYEGELKL